VVVTLLTSTTILAQATQQLQLLDQLTQEPIEHAVFRYGDQTGSSDETGQISFFLREGQEMELSHLNYGAWKISATELQELLDIGIYYVQPISINLYPATVIALRHNQSPSSSLNLEYQDRMAHDGAAVLLQSPAISGIRKSGNYGFDPVFRGFKYDQLNVVMNGAQSATAACPNRMDPPTSQMAPNMIDRIEVLKGPHALRYGAGFGGTINFIPTQLRFTDAPGVYGRLSGVYETNGLIPRTEGLLGFSGKRYDVGVFAAWSQGQDYQAGNDQTVPADFQRGSFGTNLGWKITDQQTLRVSAIYNVARDADFPALPMDLREDDTWLFNVQHQVSFQTGTLSNWSTTLFGSMVDHRMDNLLKPLDPRMLNAETIANTNNYGGRTEGVWRFDKATWYLGADLRVEEATGIRTREFLLGPNAGKILSDNAWQNGQISKTGIFSEYQLPLNQYQLVFAGRVEYNRAQVADPSPEFLALHSENEITQINPSLSVGITRKQPQGFQFGVWAGRVQRSGGLAERYINFFPIGQDPYELVGNPDLSPEVNYQVDLSVGWNNEQTVVSLDLFAGYLEDFISSVIDTTLSPRIPMSPGVRQFVNIENAFKTGFEVSWTQSLFANLHHQMGVAYTYAQDLEREQPLPEIAPLDFRYALVGNYFNDKLQPELSVRHVLQQSRISTEFGETTTPAFTLLDARVSYQFANWFRMSASVNNLLDQNYYEHLNRSVRGTTDPIYAPGRSFVFAFNLTF
jgi:iron complex outermembrane receptor protein